MEQYYFKPTLEELIYDLLDENKNNIEHFNRFRKCYFIGKMKKNFISFIWKVREKEFNKNLVQSNEDAIFVHFWNNFYR